MIRSKGVGVFFVTQSPTDLPSDVLGQLGNRIQHALRAFTPEDADALRKTVRTYPTSDLYDLEELLTSLGIGEAAVTLLDENAASRPRSSTRACARRARAWSPAADVEAAAKASPLWAKYGAGSTGRARTSCCRALSAPRRPRPSRSRPARSRREAAPRTGGERTR